MQILKMAICLFFALCISCKSNSIIKRSDKIRVLNKEIWYISTGVSKHATDATSFKIMIDDNIVIETPKALSTFISIKGGNVIIVRYQLGSGTCASKFIDRYYYVLSGRAVCLGELISSFYDNENLIATADDSNFERLDDWALTPTHLNQCQKISVVTTLDRSLLEAIGRE